MIEELLVGSLMFLLTTAVHAVCTLIVLRVLHAGDRVVNWREHSSANAKTLLVTALVLLMFYATLLEVAAWAGAFLAIDAMENFERAFYFSLVTYTTLGYGDIVLKEDWRILSSFAAANGIIMFGWTTAIIIAFVQSIIRYRVPQ